MAKDTKDGVTSVQVVCIFHSNPVAESVEWTNAESTQTVEGSEVMRILFFSVNIFYSVQRKGLGVA